MNAPVAITPEVLEKYPLAPGTRAFLQGRLGHFVDGEDRDSSSGQTMVVYDPSSGAAFARVAAGDAIDVDRAAQAARNAFADGRWRDVPPHEKERILRRLAQLIQDNRAVFKDLDALEGGVTGQHSEFSIQYATDITNYYAGWPTKIQGGMPPARSELVVMEVREPIGVCGVIFPWNGRHAFRSASCRRSPAATRSYSSRRSRRRWPPFSSRGCARRPAFPTVW